MSQDPNPFGGPLVPLFGGLVLKTTMSPLAFCAVAIAALLVFALPRKHVCGPFVAFLLLIPVGNQIYLGGVHWLAPRIIALFGLLRVTVLRGGEKRRIILGGLSAIDRAFFAYVACQAVAVTFRSGMQPDATLNQMGFVVDFAATYVVIRALVDDEADIYRVLKWVAGIAVILAIGMVWEQLTRQNVFGIWLQGTASVTALREGKIRSHGAFQHPLTAGAFGASLLPLFLLLWHNGRARVEAALGAISCTAIAICANSSTPLLAYTSGLFAVALWPMRRRMRAVRWGLLAVLVTLHLVMKSPVWWLIARIDLTGSSSAYHRALLVDQFINRFAEWYLVGTNGTASWGYDLWDAQNQFVSAGTAGGLLGFLLFVAMISYACAVIGKARRLAEGHLQESMCWFIGAAVFANLVAFFGVNYFDQIRVEWFLLLAMLSAAAGSVSKRLAVQATDGPDQTSRQWIVREWSKAGSGARAPASAAQ